MGVETVRGYNLDRPPGCNPKTRDHKQASIFVEFADVFRLCETHVHAAASFAQGALGLPAVHAAMRMPVCVQEEF